MPQTPGHVINHLTQAQALRAMEIFLQAYLDRTDGAGDLPTLVSDIELVADSETSDPAAWGDWTRAVKQVLDEAEAGVG